MNRTGRHMNQLIKVLNYYRYLIALLPHPMIGPLFILTSCPRVHTSCACPDAGPPAGGPGLGAHLFAVPPGSAAEAAAGPPPRQAAALFRADTDKCCEAALRFRRGPRGIKWTTCERQRRKWGRRGRRGRGGRCSFWPAWQHRRGVMGQHQRRRRRCSEPICWYISSETVICSETIHGRRCCIRRPV